MIIIFLQQINILILIFERRQARPEWLQLINLLMIFLQPVVNLIGDKPIIRPHFTHRRKYKFQHIGVLPFSNFAG